MIKLREWITVYDTKAMIDLSNVLSMQGKSMETQNNI